MGHKLKIRDIPEIDRPREKLLRKGQAALSDFELLEVLLGSGAGKTDVGTIARQVQRLLQKGTQYVTLDALQSINGVNVATAIYGGGALIASLSPKRPFLRTGPRSYRHRGLASQPA